MCYRNRGNVRERSSRVGPTRTASLLRRLSLFSATCNHSSPVFPIVLSKLEISVKNSPVVIITDSKPRNSGQRSIARRNRGCRSEPCTGNSDSVTDSSPVLQTVSGAESDAITVLHSGMLGEGSCAATRGAVRDATAVTKI